MSSQRSHAKGLGATLLLEGGGTFSRSLEEVNWVTGEMPVGLCDPDNFSYFSLLPFALCSYYETHNLHRSKVTRPSNCGWNLVKLNQNNSFFPCWLAQVSFHSHRKAGNGLYLTLWASLSWSIKWEAGMGCSSQMTGLFTPIPWDLSSLVSISIGFSQDMLFHGSKWLALSVFGRRSLAIWRLTSFVPKMLD